MTMTSKEIDNLVAQTFFYRSEAMHAQAGMSQIEVSALVHEAITKDRKSRSEPETKPGEVAIKYPVPTEKNASTIAYGLVHSFLEILGQFPDIDISDDGIALKEKMMTVLFGEEPDAYMHHFRAKGRHVAEASLSKVLDASHLFPMYSAGTVVEHWTQPLYLGGECSETDPLTVNDPEAWVPPMGAM